MLKSAQKLAKIDFFNPVVISKPPDALGIRDMVFRVGTQGFCSQFWKFKCYYIQFYYIQMLLKQNSNC